MSKGKLLAGLFIGAATGAALGLLLAPDKGSDTRNKISKKTKKLGKDLQDKLNQAKDSIKTKYDNIKGDANEMMEQEKQKVNQNFG